jgi:two-component system response regulator AtoC
MTDARLLSRKITLTETADGIFPLDASFPAHASFAARRFGLLIFCNGEAQFKLLDDGTSVVVGRKKPSEIVVADPAVSRQHARFVRKQDEVWVEDLDSRHGTFLGSRRITRERIGAFEEVSLGEVRVMLAATRSTAPGEPDIGAIAEGEIVIESARMKRLYADVVQAARGRLPVLVIGETGTGKEHVVRAIHRASARRAKPLVAVNCAAIAPSLLESVLFGHERGAFTGAYQRSQGVFERAHGGVLFLDEVGDLANGAQVALLRALETQKFARVGGTAEISVDVQFIAATHCNLEAMVEAGTFRRDLYFRLNGIQLPLPPLRERVEEIGPLTRLFLAKACREWGLPPREISPQASDALARCAWPGNVRQLRYAVERAALLANGPLITLADLPQDVAGGLGGTSSSMPLLAAASFAGTGNDLDLRLQLKEFERRLFEEALRCAAGNRQEAAKLLRIPQRTFFRKLRAHGAGIGEGPGVSDIEALT